MPDCPPADIPAVVNGNKTHPVKRFCAGLCLLLTLVFAGTSAANALDRVQHLPGGPVQHAHSPLSVATITVEDDHHTDHDAGHHGEDDGDDRGSGQQPGHHHHADGSSGLPAFAATDRTVAVDASNPPSLPRDALLLGLALHGPERPPKPSTRTA